MYTERNELEQRRNLPRRGWIGYIMHVTNEYDWIGKREGGSSKRKEASVLGVFM